jgi:DNA-binding MarR family transcriptional regulator
MNRQLMQAHLSAPPRPAAGRFDKPAAAPDNEASPPSPEDPLTRPRRSRIDSLPFLINRVGTALAAGFAERALEAHGLGIPAWRVLVALADRGEQRQIDLATLASIETSTLSRLITRLIRLDLVSRTRSRASSREVAIVLTAKGGDIVRRLQPVARRYERLAVAGVDPADQEIMRRCLRLMHENIEAVERARPEAAEPTEPAEPRLTDARPVRQIGRTTGQTAAFRRRPRKAR